jgi:hypothetical protein
VSVTVDSFHFKNTIVNGQERNIESATTEVENQYVLLTSASLLVKLVGEGGG